ncbi:MAG: AarF/ABC1/UbiB kinase family protein [Syntrophobacteraceae bacterium]|nr:AarF/ABC1/UbiB kinase family protein [Syntrophobacteraceae bacterium]
MNWESLIAENILGWLLPDSYARYRGPVLSALALFLKELPANRIKDIAADQARLPSEASALDRLVRLLRCCPVLHKIGQTLARDRNLPAELRLGLQRLESLAPLIPMEAVKQVLEQELGPLDRLGITLLHPALAEASVAVVVPFQFFRGKSPRSGVFKVLKPSIEERMEGELALLERVGSCLDKRCEKLRIPKLDYRDSFNRVREKLINEVRLDREQENLSLARRLYSGNPRVAIPELFDFCTPKVTAMERLTGKKVTEWGADFQKKEMARLIIDTLLVQPIFVKEPGAPFHADPHAGNLLHLKDGRLAVLDWSLVGRITETERVSLMQIILGGLACSPERITDALSRLLTAAPGDPPALRDAVDRSLVQIKNSRLPGFSWLKELLDDVVRCAGLRLGADPMLFRRALHMVEGVAADLGGDAGLIERVFLSEFGYNFSAEWPLRFFAPPDSHDFPTRISNYDLAALLMSYPLNLPRLWPDI